jgi:hypothetical protein
VVVSLFTPLEKSNSAKSKVFKNIYIYELAKNKPLLPWLPWLPRAGTFLPA